MANANNPHGFTYLGISEGHPPRIKTGVKLVGVGTAIFKQDVVYRLAGAAGEDDPILTYTGTPGTTIPFGVSRNWGAASTRSIHHVIVDQRAEYEAQDDGATDGIVQADMGLNANVSIAVAGNADTKFSGHQIGEASVTTTNSLDLHLLRPYPDPLNVSGSKYFRVIVKFNKIRETTQIAGV